MPDTMIQTEALPGSPASCGVLDGYRSASIGKLVAARAKAAAAIKAIIKDKKADIPNKNGGRGYQYSYADLADVLDAVEDAISEQGLAIFQTTQTRQRDGTFLVTTLAHESDQWIASDIRLKSADAGPQVYGSEMTYLRRYAVLAILALAPEADDDGKTAQDRADQARQRPQERREDRRRYDVPHQPMQALPAPSVEVPAPVHVPIQGGNLGQWASDAWDVLSERPVEWRRSWLELHAEELAEIRAKRADWANNLVGLAYDQAEEQAAE
jgi:hypothetical protein